jgi:hypothetical protein
MLIKLVSFRLYASAHLKLFLLKVLLTTNLFAALQIFETYSDILSHSVSFCETIYCSKLQRRLTSSLLS